MTRRTEELEEKIRGLDDADDIMMVVLEVFSRTDVIPDAGKYYTFVYRAKTNDIIYDEHPLVAVTLVEKWGFQGINFHWNTSRNYTWQEIVGNLHIIENDEIEYLRSLPYAKYTPK
tara:strand:- start:676 stop:1023 length:348 start_codon:yes stop_codon:yes gene_type:complete